MNSGNNPDTDPANNDTLVGAVRFAFFKLLQQVNGMLPVQVIAYDRTTNRVQVQHFINIVTTGNQQVPRPQVASVPALILGAGGFMISFPINTGDKGWLLANDRDISAFLQSYGQSAPVTGRMFNFADGLFIPDIMTDYTIGSGNNDSMVIQSVDGTLNMALGSSGLSITSTAPVTVTTPTFAVVGNITATGSITPFV